MMRFFGLLSFILTTTLTSAHLALQRPFVRNSTEEIAAEGSFGYNKNIGPISWYGLDPSKNQLCATGSGQSPINIERGKTAKLAVGLQISIPALPWAFIKNNGHTVQIDLKNKGSLIDPWNNANIFVLQQLHFHTPSEHHFDGLHDDVEMHLVFKHESSGILIVIGQNFYVSKDPSFQLLDGLLANIGQIRSPGDESYTGYLDFTSLTNLLAWYPPYTYQGSLTTPPCSEMVRWFVSDFAIGIEVSTYHALKSATKFNARILQDEYGKENSLMASGKTLKKYGWI